MLRPDVGNTRTKIHSCHSNLSLALLRIQNSNNGKKHDAHKDEIPSTENGDVVIKNISFERLRSRVHS